MVGKQKSFEFPSCSGVKYHRRRSLVLRFLAVQPWTRPSTSLFLIDLFGGANCITQGSYADQIREKSMARWKERKSIVSMHLHPHKTLFQGLHCQAPHPEKGYHPPLQDPVTFDSGSDFLQNGNALSIDPGSLGEPLGNATTQGREGLQGRGLGPTKRSAVALRIYQQLHSEYTTFSLI